MKAERQDMGKPDRRALVQRRSVQDANPRTGVAVGQRVHQQHAVVLVGAAGPGDEQRLERQRIVTAARPQVTCPVVKLERPVEELPPASNAWLAWNSISGGVSQVRTSPSDRRTVCSLDPPWGSQSKCFEYDSPDNRNRSGWARQAHSQITARLAVSANACR